MISLNGIRNTLWSLLAFGIVACAATPMPSDKIAVARSSVDRAEQAQAAQFAQVQLATARNKLVVAQTAAENRDAELAARMADQADIDAQLAEATARARQQEQHVTEMEAALRDLREEATRNAGTGANTPQPQPTPPQ